MDVLTLVFDVVIIAILLISVLIAVLRGFIREVLTIFGVIGGVAAAYFLGPLLQPLFHGWLVGDTSEEEVAELFGIIPYDMLADFLAYGIIFVIVVIILSLLSHMLSSWARAVGLGVVDRILGAAFGVIRAVIILGILYMPLYMLADKEDREGWFGTAKSYPYVERITEQMHKFMPDSVTEGAEKEKGNIADKLRKEMEAKFQEVTGDKKESKAQDDDAAATLSKDAEESDAPPPTPPSTPSGYEDNQRERLEQLFEDGIEGMNEGNTNE